MAKKKKAKKKAKKKTTAKKKAKTVKKKASKKIKSKSSTKKSKKKSATKKKAKATKKKAKKGKVAKKSSAKKSKTKKKITKKVAKKAKKKASKKAAKKAAKKKAPKRVQAKPIKRTTRATISPVRKAVINSTKSHKSAAEPTVAWESFFTPLDDRVVVSKDEAMEKTAGGIYIPDLAKQGPSSGKVVSVGRGRLNKKGKIRPMDVKAGDKILYEKYVGPAVELNGVEVLILREHEILGIVE